MKQIILAAFLMLTIFSCQKQDEGTLQTPAGDQSLTRGPGDPPPPWRSIFCRKTTTINPDQWEVKIYKDPLYTTPATFHITYDMRDANGNWINQGWIPVTSFPVTLNVGMLGPANISMRITQADGTTGIHPVNWGCPF